MNYHDILARIGFGSAHPGGFAATLELLADRSLPDGASILEIGCGTGRTSCYLAAMGYNVTAVDNHPLMIEKAIKRAEAEQAEIHFIQADSASLPLDSGCFDIVFIESVTVFLNPEPAIQEYARVLREEGQIWDRELCLLGSLDDKAHASINPQNLGIRQLPLQHEWERLFRNSFREVQICSPRLLAKDYSYPDPYQMSLIDPTVLQDKKAIKLIEQYESFLAANQDRLGECVIAARK